MSLSPMETPPVVTTTSPRSRQARSLSRRESGSSTEMPQSTRGTECCDRSEISVASETTIINTHLSFLRTPQACLPYCYHGCNPGEVLRRPAAVRIIILFYAFLNRKYGTAARCRDGHILDTFPPKVSIMCPKCDQTQICAQNVPKLVNYGQKVS